MQPMELIKDYEIIDKPCEKDDGQCNLFCPFLGVCWIKESIKDGNTKTRKCN